MVDPWEKAYVYGVFWWGSTVAHIAPDGWLDAWRNTDRAYCGVIVNRFNRTPDPYPVCKNCLRTKRAKELGL